MDLVESFKKISRTITLKPNEIYASTEVTELAGGWKIITVWIERRRPLLSQEEKKL